VWIYKQSTGELVRNGNVWRGGYSGCGEGKNNPTAENKPDVGPLPRGLYWILGPPEETEKHGPYVLRLEPNPQNDMYGRSGFLIHGDSKIHPGQASEGCIILPRPLREHIYDSGDRTLEVVA
jgi:hypothetical protein